MKRGLWWAQAGLALVLTLTIIGISVVGTLAFRPLYYHDMEVLEIAEYTGLSEEEIRERVMEAAAFSGVEPEWMEKSPFDLSGGQKRRVALAGVIAMRPEVLVLDEPGAGLDPRGRNSIFEKIVHYQKTTGSTVLIVSHSMEDMARLCDDVVVLYRAKIVKQGSGREVFSHADELSKIGLDIPQITRLLQMLKEKGMPISDDIYTVDEAVAALKQIL